MVKLMNNVQMYYMLWYRLLHQLLFEIFSPVVINKIRLVWIVILLSIGYSEYSFAADTVVNPTSIASSVLVPDLVTMLTNLENAVPSFSKLVTAGSYVVGMFLMISALAKMKHFGEMRGMMSREHAVWGPIFQFLIGACLIYLPTSIRVTLYTLWSYNSPMAYTSSDASNQQFISICYHIIQLIGTISFIRGLLYLNQAANDKGQGQNPLSKSLSHIIGGILCINIYGTVQTLEATVGMVVN